MTRQEICKILHDDVVFLRIGLQRATARFNATLNDIPSHLPHPDGGQRIRNAAIENAAALSKLRIALRRETDFILRGTVPKDIQ